MALGTDYQYIGRIFCEERPGNTDGSYRFEAKYENTSDPTKVNLYIKCTFECGGGTRLTGGGCTVNASGFSSGSMGLSSNSSVTLGPKQLTYASNGTLSYSVSMSISGVSDPTWRGDTATYDADPTGTASANLVFPNIDPTPTISITGVSIVSGGYNNQAIASISKIRVAVSYQNIRNSLNYEWSGAGQNGTGSVAVSYSSTAQSTTFDINVPANSDNYTLTIKVGGANNSFNIKTPDYSYSVKGYYLPYYTSETYTMRCDVNGNADSQGEYGRLYLKWATCLIDNTNTLVNCTVKLNGTVLVNGQNCVITGSIANGYLNYIFPLQLNTQGDLGITFQDHILTAPEITSLAVPKSIMPLSLYQDNTNVGITIGRMSTSAGFYEALDFYLKGKNHGTFYEIYIDTSGNLHVGSYTVQYVGGNPV